MALILGRPGVAEASDRDQSQALAAPDERSGFPPGSYTPFGYLDNPYHSWDLHPSGVLRSVPPLGIGLYYPAGPGGYFDYARNSIYRSILRVGFRVDDKVYYDTEDFSGPGTTLDAVHHSKNILTLAVAMPASDATLAFFQVDEQTLACWLRMRNRSAESAEVHVIAVQRLELGASEWWGRDGIAGYGDGDAVVLRSFAAGPLFALSADAPSESRVVTPDAAVLKRWMSSGETPGARATTYYPEPLEAGLAWKLDLDGSATTVHTITLTRGDNQPSVLAAASVARSRAASVYLKKQAEDDEFWSRAPRLEGDFPDHWKHSWVYDFETLRTMVRRPLGVYKHAWDGMQIQAPRNVLAETSIDMWALSYADPETAQVVLLGQFQDAIEPNVPCMREDGVMNMVAADGSACGTSLQWCYPFYCIDSVFRRTADRAWIERLYRYLAAHLDWTLKQRTDRDGWIVAKCSWESGMDASRRFLLKQPTGGELIDFVRVAELQAAMSHAARTLAGYAPLAGRGGDAARWTEVAATYAAKTRALWFEGWFYDVDARTGKPIIIPGRREVTQVGPVMCGVATPDQVRAMVPAMREYESNQRFWLEWPSHVLPYAESMWRAGEREVLSRVLYEIADRVYSSMDRREIEPEKKIGWPGVSCEMWGLEGARGGECYGWGATLPSHIIRSIFGFRESVEFDRPVFELGPNIPPALWASGKAFKLRNVHYRRHRIDLHYECREAPKLLVKIISSVPAPRVVDENGRQVQLSSVGGTWSFEADNHALYRVEYQVGAA